MLHVRVIVYIKLAKTVCNRQRPPPHPPHPVRVKILTFNVCKATFQAGSEAANGGLRTAGR
jgi:hypothetical protein